MKKILTKGTGWLLSVLMVMSLVTPLAFVTTTAASLPRELSEDNSDFVLKQVEDNDNFVLYADEKSGVVAVGEKKTGKIWYSNPMQGRNDPKAQGATKMTLMSQMEVLWVNSKNTASLSASYYAVNMKGELNYEKIDNGVKFIYNFEKEGFIIPVTYTLHDDYLEASIVSDEIKEEAVIVKKNIPNPEIPGEYMKIDVEEYNKISTINFLPYFGAPDLESDGYILLPDGSGSIMELNSAKKKGYSEYIYGYDTILGKSQIDSVTQSAKMPIYGIKDNSDALLAIIDSAESKTQLNAFPGGSISSYNSVGTIYTYANFVSVALPAKSGKNAMVQVLDKNSDNSENYKIRYYPLMQKDAGYVEMASKYQDYLRNDKGVTAQSSQIPDLYLDLYGYVNKVKSYFGIPVNRPEILTTFDEVEKIVDELQAGGVEDMVVSYSGWVDDGYFAQVPTDADIVGGLGGKSGIKNLDESLKEKGVELYPSIDPVNAYEFGNGVSKFNDTAKTINKISYTQREYLTALYTPDPEVAPWYLIAPHVMPEIAEDFTKDFNKLGIGNLALDAIGAMCYSNFTSDGDKYAQKIEECRAEIVELLTNSEATEENIAELNEEIAEAQAKLDASQKSGRLQSVIRYREAFEVYGAENNLMFSNANSYVIPYATHIINSPTDSSGYDIEEYAVPFYQLVMRGLVPTGLQSVNMDSEPERMILKCLETGSAPMFTWIYRDPAKLKDTDLNYIYSADYNAWKDLAIDMVMVIKEFNEKVEGQDITGHKYEQLGVFTTTYANGVSVTVNYNHDPVKVDGKTIDGLSYSVKG